MRQPRQAKQTPPTRPTKRPPPAKKPARKPSSERPKEPEHLDASRREFFKHAAMAGVIGIAAERAAEAAVKTSLKAMRRGGVAVVEAMIGESVSLPTLVRGEGYFLVRYTLNFENGYILKATHILSRVETTEECAVAWENTAKVMLLFAQQAGLTFQVDDDDLDWKGWLA